MEHIAEMQALPAKEGCFIMYYNGFTVSMTKESFEELVQSTIQKAIHEVFVKNPESLFKFQKEEKLVTVKRLTEILQVSKQTIYNWRDEGLIKPMKVGGRVLYDLNKIKLDIRSNLTAYSKRKDHAQVKEMKSFAES